MQEQEKFQVCCPVSPRPVTPRFLGNPSTPVHRQRDPHKWMKREESGRLEETVPEGPSSAFDRSDEEGHVGRGAETDQATRNRQAGVILPTFPHSPHQGPSQEELGTQSCTPPFKKACALPEGVPPSPNEPLPLLQTGSCCDPRTPLLRVESPLLSGNALDPRDLFSCDGIASLSSRSLPHDPITFFLDPFT